MEHLISYQTLAWIAGIGNSALVVLLILIFKRKIGRPLSEAEQKEKRIRKANSELQKKQRREARELEWKNEQNRMQEQDKKILLLPRPVTFVSLDGDNNYGRTICVQDGTGKPHTFHLADIHLQSFHAFNSLYHAARGPHYYGKIGAVLFQ